MSIHEQLSPSKPDAIGHPLQPGWLEAGLDIMQGEPRDALERRFGVGYPELDQLLKRIGDVSLSLDIGRQTHEKDSLYKLQLAGAAMSSDEQVAYQDELAKHRTFVGKPNLVGHQIRWFADVATTAFANLDNLKATSPGLFRWLACNGNGVAKVGLDLGGRRLAGMWDRTRDLDELTNSIPRAVEEAMPDAVTLSRGELKEEAGYTFTPIRTTKRMREPKNISMGTVRQRRIENVVRIPGNREVLVIKELSSIILLDELRNGGHKNAADRRRILLEIEDEEASERNQKENSSAAQAAGRVFERAIQRKGTARWVIPLSGHLYVLTAADRPVVAEP